MSDKDNPEAQDGRSENDLNENTAEECPSRIRRLAIKSTPAFHEGPQPDIRINALVGNYKILSLLGRGGLGEVYKARDMVLGRDVAIKFLRGASNETHRILFEREAKTIATLNKHPNIVGIHQWGEYRGRNFIVFEFVENNLACLLEEYSEGLPLGVALRITLECADALQEAHRHAILHRNIKPSNILIEPANGPAKLTDFGLVRSEPIMDNPHKDGYSASPYYMSPEQANMEPLDGRTDVFSLGMVLYELLSGRRPYDGPEGEIFQRLCKNNRVPLQDRRPDLPKAICDLVEKATAFRREDRYQTAGELARLLRLALQSLERKGKVSLDLDPAPFILKAKDPPTSLARKMAELALIVAGVMVAMQFLLLMLLPGQKSQDATKPAVMESADFALNRKDFWGAATIFREILETDPHSELAHYGYCLAMVHLGKLDEATSLAGAIDSPDLRAEAQAAIAFLSPPEDARERIMTLAKANPTPYIQTLLARLDILDGHYDRAVSRLINASPDHYRFKHQHTEALAALGQAQFHLGQYPDARSTFQRAAQVDSGTDSRTEMAYLQEIDTRLDAARREDIRLKVAEIKTLIEQAEPMDDNPDTWTSRPLTFAILPGEVGRARLAVESGLADLLPALLGNTLATRTPLIMLDRALLREVLMEQELSAMLSSAEGQLRLGRVLGARLLIKCNFVRIGTGEKAMITLNDTETTQRIPVSIVDIMPPVDLDAVSETIASALWKGLAAHYPVQGRLFSGPQGPAINVGASAGVLPGMVFEILTEPDTPPIPAVSAVVNETPGDAVSKVILSGVDAERLGNTPETGWYVRARRENMF